MVTRLVREKGVDLVLGAAGEMVQQGGRLVILGAGDPVLEKALTELAGKHSKQIVVRIGYDEGLARRIFGGSDFFLMPSRSEPCGLTQMYAMRYGSIPVVGDVGGLHDTVEDWNPGKKVGTGLRFEPTEKGMRGALSRALALWDTPTMMKLIRQNGIKKSWSWKVAVPAYEKIYRSLVG